MTNIAIIGQSAFGENVASEVSKIKDCKIVGIFTPHNHDNDPLYQYALKNKINIYRFKKLRSIKAIEEFKKLEVDLLVMAYVTDIVPMEIINNPTKGTIQYHPSLLPKHRGPSSINWAIINGDKSTGITIFWPDEGLDTGPILMQKEVDISPDDTTGSLYFEKLFPMGVNSLVNSIKLVISNKAPKIIQDELNASYESWCSKKEIDWVSLLISTDNLCSPTSLVRNSRRKYGVGIPVPYLSRAIRVLAPEGKVSSPDMTSGN